MEISRRQYLRAALAGGCALCAGGAAYLLSRSGETGAHAVEAPPPEGGGTGPPGPIPAPPAPPAPPGPSPGPTARRGRYEPLGEALARDAGEWANEPAVRIAGADRVFYRKRANWWKKLPGGRVECRLCPRHCVIGPGDRGTCEVRENQGGELRTLVWGNPCALHADPIEKKPLFHVRPGARAYSLATAGCNFDCRFCQNWNISQARPEELDNAERTAEQIARAAKAERCELIACTYSEPVVFWEYMYDCAAAARGLGLGAVMISNGHIETAPLKRLLEVMTAVKVDLKAYTEKFYRDVCGGTLKPVLRTLETLAASGKWFEIVYLVVPTLNDDRRDVAAMCGWIVKTLGDEVPLHFSVFHPTYKLRNLPRTPIATVRACADAAADAGLKFVYVGNARDRRESTYCPGCGAAVIGRYGYAVTERNYEVAGGIAKCSKCGRRIPGVFS